jgi:hypothetical protein
MMGTLTDQPPKIGEAGRQVFDRVRQDIRHRPKLSANSSVWAFASVRTPFHLPQRQRRTRILR